MDAAPPDDHVPPPPPTVYGRHRHRITGGLVLGQLPDGAILHGEGGSPGPPAPPNSRSIAVSCPHCMRIEDVTVGWDLPAPDTASGGPRTEWLPVQITCVQGHQWADALPVSLLTLIVERLYLAQAAEGDT